MPGLDGLRGIAVILVIIFHVLPLSLPGGFLGVDIFFVLSGYLITSLILHELRDTGQFSFFNFYRRRLLRLMPALLVVIVTLLCMTVFLPPFPGAFDSFLQEVGWALVYLTNWARAFGYYPDPSFLPHTWSLAIEEQFYFIWPLLLVASFFLAKKTPWLLVWFIVVTIAAVYVWRWWLFAHEANIDRIYNGLDTRADALMWGALLAVISVLRNEKEFSKKIRYLAWPAISWMVYMTATASWYSPLHYQLPLLAFYVATIVLIAILSLNDSSSTLVRLFSWSPLKFVGKISYGLYLWHFPVQRFLLPLDLSPFFLLLVVFLFTFILAVISWYGVEKRFLRKRYQDGMSIR